MLEEEIELVHIDYELSTKLGLDTTKSRLRPVDGQGVPDHLGCGADNVRVGRAQGHGDIRIRG